MDSLSLSRSDLKFLFTLSSIIPTLSIILGFCIASFPLTHNISTSTSTRDEMSNPQVKVSTKNETKKLADGPAASNTNQASDIAKRYIVQAGLFSSIEHAKRLSSSLTRKGLNTQIVKETRNGVSLFRVIVGSFALEGKAKSCKDSIEQKHSIKLYIADTSSFKPGNLDTVI